MRKTSFLLGISLRSKCKKGYNRLINFIFYFVSYFFSIKIEILYSVFWEHKYY